MDRVELLPFGTDAGLFERVMLHETVSPGFRDIYDRAKSQKAMRLMRQVFENRLRNRPYFGGSHVHTALDLLRMPGQFAGFAAYPRLDAKFMDNVTTIIQIANDPHNPDQQSYRDHVEDARAAATEASPPADAILANVAAWRKEGHDGPGGYLKPALSLQGNTFYVLTPGVRHSTKERLGS